MYRIQVRYVTVYLMCCTYALHDHIQHKLSYIHLYTKYMPTMHKRFSRKEICLSCSQALKKFRHWCQSIPCFFSSMKMNLIQHIHSKVRSLPYIEPLASLECIQKTTLSFTRATEDTEALQTLSVTTFRCLPPC